MESNEADWYLFSDLHAECFGFLGFFAGNTDDSRRKNIIIRMILEHRADISQYYQRLQEQEILVFTSRTHPNCTAAIPQRNEITEKALI